MAASEIVLMADVDPLLEPGWRASIRHADGIAFHIVEAGRPGDPVVILLHGFPEFWWAWRHQIGPLAAAGYHVVVPDLRGYNRSTAPQDIAAYHLDTLAADVVAIADAVGADRFHLVGHDWGAVIAWWTAARHAGRIDRLAVMDGPHPDAFGGEMLMHPLQALRSSYVAFFQLPWMPEAMLGAFDFAGLRLSMRSSGRAGTFEKGALDRYAEAWARPGSLTAMLNYYRALRLRPQGGEPARIAPPTLILWARGDAFLEAHVAAAGLALCERGVLEFVEDASHWLHLDQPDRVNARLVAWLGEGRSHPASSAPPLQGG